MLKNIFTTADASELIDTSYSPEIFTELPDIKFTGSIASLIMEVTLEHKISYHWFTTGQTPVEKITIRRLRKKYTIGATTPNRITIEILEATNTTDATTIPTDPNNYIQIFKIEIDPSKRGEQKVGANWVPNTLPTPNTSITNRNLTNGNTFEDDSTKTQNEVVTANGPYEAYSKPLLKIISSSNVVVPYQDGTTPESDIKKQNVKFIIEYGSETGWRYTTIGSLLKDLLKAIPPNFLKLVIVGNHQVAPNGTISPDDLSVNTYSDENQRIIYAQTLFTALSSEDIEAKWQQFMFKRAENLKKLIFGEENNLNIELLPAQKVSLLHPFSTYNKDNTGKYNIPDADISIGTFYRGTLLNYFYYPNHVTGTVPDVPASIITQMNKLNLFSGLYSNGGILLWFPLKLQITNILFDTNSSNVLSSDPAIQQNNKDAFDRLRIFLNFVNNTGSYTTNLAAVKIKIHGHTDVVGTSSFNQALSSSRATAVYSELTTSTPAIPWPSGITQPVPLSWIDSYVGHGEDFLYVQTPETCLDERYNKKNRRVEIEILSITIQ